MSKRTSYRTTTLIAIVILLLAQTAPAIAGPPPGKGKPPTQAKWTLMVYIVGDNNLDEYVPLDIETELAPAGSNEDVAVVALADRADTAEWTQTLLFYVTQDMEATPENAVQDWGEANMGDPQTLIDFIRWTKIHHPADHYALSLWNHGWSWRPDHSMRDETDGDTLDQHELEAVLEEVGPVDVIMYDACQMATIENQATVRAYSQAIFHSQEYVNWDGIEYELVIPALHENPEMTPEELAIVINQSASTNPERTGSAVALNEDWDALIVAVDAWAIALDEGLPEYRQHYVGAFRAAKYFWQDRTARDLYDAARIIGDRIDDPVIQEASQAVMEAVQAAVLDEWHRQNLADAHGISIFLPATVDDLDDPATEKWNEFEYYREYLVFSRLTHWDEFLDAFINGE
ncbi:MAG: clostripain-related cysteine peptidase [Anaerolineae bacterium]